MIEKKNNPNLDELMRVASMLCPENIDKLLDTAKSMRIAIMNEKKFKEKQQQTN